MRPRRNGTAGFSLAEALVALAIAALLAAALTRFVSGTRANALKIQQEVALELASDDLLEHLATGKSLPGRIDGHSGSIAWRIDIEPVTFSATAEVVSEKQSTAGSTGQPEGLGSSPQGSTPSQAGAQSPTASALSPSWGSIASSSQASQATAKPKTRITWSPYRVVAVVKAPSGRSYAVDTIRNIAQKPEPSEQNESTEQH